ncbi:4'-phosphopantetheinyl transferase family protein [Bacillus cytotoxicus]|uniref:4'-phosphopantetheinyl transferase family protein n=1 Tax=Bacillus cytotoxicus TaxID=580165 RepID=UPI003D7D0766
MKVFTLHIDRLLQTSEFHTLMKHISPERITKINQLVFPKDKHRSLLSEIFVRFIIQEELHLPNHNITFQVGPYGKPFVENLPSFHFNISHSGNWIVCAIDCHPIGIDIEKIAPIDYSIAKHFFCYEEYEDLMAKIEPERMAYFYHLWTIKESFVKQSGAGLTVPLHSFSISIDSSQNVHIRTIEKTNPVCIEILHIGTGYKSAVCSYKKNKPTKITYIKLEDLLFYTPFSRCKFFLPD